MIVELSPDVVDAVGTSLSVSAGSTLSSSRGNRLREIYRLRSIRHCHGAATVLDIEDLAILEGRLYHLAGPNGAGKSTLLNLLAFLVPPTGQDRSFRSRPPRPRPSRSLSPAAHLFAARRRKTWISRPAVSILL